MKHYSLKDKELLKRLNEIDRFFEQSLNEDARSALDDDGVTTNLHIGRDDLEITDIYDPEGWNEYPEVTPPNNLWMRCETEFGSKYAAFYAEGAWHTTTVGTAETPCRFRQWDD